jgi:hypothetical protein
MTIRVALFSGLLLFFLTRPHLASDLSPAATFDELKKLCGEWTGTNADGRTEKVSYRMVANDTVLVEAWVLGSGREALTLYHRDGNDLIATHYCPRGNQPRLKLKSASSEKGFVFEFVSATNLPDPEAAHQHRFEIQIHGTDSFSRGETYLEKGKQDSGAVSYSRSR